MIDRTQPDTATALGAFLRIQRARRSPGELGLPAGTRRRTPGLRREEVAQLCGVSTTWYTWVEQGRDVSMSPFALARLATGLRLAPAERTYLFALAGRHDPVQAEDHSDEVGAAVRASVAAITAPAYVLDRNWDARCWNVPAERLFAGWLDRPGTRNLLRFIFLDPQARRLIHDWEERAHRVVAEFRAQIGQPAVGSSAARLLDELVAQSEDFQLFWTRHDVLNREGGERTFDHPADGFLRFQQVTYGLVSQPTLRLTILMRES